MKSAHRHELQTNALAQRLDVAIQRFRPYVSTITGVIVALAVVMLIWSYMSKSSASRQGDAWSAYNQVIGASNVNLEELHRAAGEYPGTNMQQLAEITWADGQVFEASQNYIYNRIAAKAAMERAANAYTSIVGTSSDQSLVDRAHVGLARIYEMRGDLEKSQEEYRAVRGGYAAYAKAQADRLAKPDAKDTYAWLATAVPPRVPASVGPGTTGQQPEFSAEEMALPDVTLEPGAPGATPPATSIDDLLKGLGELPAEGGKSPEGETTPPVNPALPTTPEGTPAAESGTPAAETAPASEGAAPSTSDDSSGESGEPPADSNAAPPPAETNGTEDE